MPQSWNRSATAGLLKVVSHSQRGVRVSPLCNVCATCECGTAISTRSRSRFAASSAVSLLCHTVTPRDTPPQALAASEQMVLFCDLHGHSRKRNIFMYGCENLKGPWRLHERVFPRLLADCCPHFSLPGCSFKVLRSKENTGRVVVCRQFGLPASYTLEASFCGADFGQARAPVTHAPPGTRDSSHTSPLTKRPATPHPATPHCCDSAVTLL